MTGSCVRDVSLKTSQQSEFRSLKTSRQSESRGKDWKDGRPGHVFVEFPLQSWARWSGVGHVRWVSVVAVKYRPCVCRSGGPADEGVSEVSMCVVASGVVVLGDRLE